MTSSVVDASIVLRWYLPGEEAEAESRRLLDEYLRGQVRLMAPGLLPHEIINGVIVAGRRGRIPQGEDQRVVQSFVDLEIPLIDVTPLYERILWFSKTYQRSAYDGAYLALAENLQVPLITGDRKLYQALRLHIPWILWIGEYKGPPGLSASP